MPRLSYVFRCIEKLFEDHKKMTSSVKFEVGEEYAAWCPLVPSSRPDFFSVISVENAYIQVLWANNISTSTLETEDFHKQDDNTIAWRDNVILIRKMICEQDKLVFLLKHNETH